MTAGDASAQFAEVISSLDGSKIPDKLHCPSCDKFLLNGWRLPCCDQTLCETCHSAITDRCPICEHQPMSQDLCKPNKALRNTAKAYLKTAEKKLADERAKAAAADAPTSVVITPQSDAPTPTPAPANLQAEGNVTTEEVAPTEELKVEEPTPFFTQHPLADEPQPSIEVPPAQAAPVPTPVEATPQAEGSLDLAEGSVDALQQYSQDGNKKRSEEKEPQAMAMATQEQSQEQSKADSVNSGTPGMMANMNATGFPNMMNMNMGFNNVDNPQMMQYMLANGMGNFNPMMGMSNMGMNPMSQGMFGGFGGPNMGMAGMNGINMGMNFDPTQGMYAAGFGQNSSMWNGPQNNNPNAFANGMGGEYGSNSGYGYNMSQQGNFHQHQYPNGDFQGGQYGRGYSRGRGRGRGGFARGRGYNQNVQGNYSNYQQPYEQQQQEIQNMQAAMYNNQVDQQNEQVESKEEPARDEHQDQLNFAPGGQEEVQEALGDDYPQAETKAEAEENATTEEKPEAEVVPETEATKDEPQIQEETKTILPIPTLSPTTYEDEVPVIQEVTSIAMEPEPMQPAMPPPSAPLGPAAQFADPGRDYGFRGRGHGRMSSRGRGSFHGTNGHPFSPVKAAPEPPFKPATEPKGTGVVGAPTGPKAMRAPPVNAPSAPLRDRGGGFQIVGRASMTSQGSKSAASENSRSVTPGSGPAERNHDSRPQSRHRSRHQQHSRRESEDENDRERRRDRKYRKSRHEEHDDYQMQEADQDRPRSVTPEEPRRTSHRRDRDRDRDHHSSTKHKSSRSHRHREDSQADGDYDMGDDKAEPKPIRDIESRTSRREHHSSRSRRHEERDREERDREDSRRDHRKRSRRELDEADDYEEVEDEDSRHRSRRPKRDHHREESVNGQQRSEKSSAAATPVEREREPEKDMHTLEREARNRERMLKEQQRRENALNAEKGGGGNRRAVAGGRRVSYKYEDEAQSAMVEQEREAQRWR